MKRFKWLLLLLTGIMVLAMVSTAFAATVREQQQETRQKVAETLNKLYERKPSARTALKNAEGYALIFAFIDRTAWNKFTSSEWSYGGQVDAAVNDGVNGGSFEGAVQAAPGIFVYQMTTKGLTVELSLKGTNYYRDKKLNN